jgi:hypothetical protein
VTIKPGDAFSREQLNESIKQIGDRLGNDGYAFANVNAAPELDKEKKLVAFTFLVDPGRKVYVNRVNIAGNTKSKDEVIRREMRQMEGAWYATDKINRSRERIERLSYFKDITIETPPVPMPRTRSTSTSMSPNKSTGNMMLGAGYSSSVTASCCPARHHPEQPVRHRQSSCAANQQRQRQHGVLAVLSPSPISPRTASAWATTCTAATSTPRPRLGRSPTAPRPSAPACAWACRSPNTIPSTWAPPSSNTASTLECRVPIT